jgi:hypothetical protein
MEYTKLRFNEDVAGGDYASFLEYSLSMCSIGLLILRPNYRPSGRGIEFGANLQPSVVEIREQSEWPGTKLSRRTVKVMYFIFDEGTAALLRRTTTSLFDWRWPELPEDLCLMRNDQSVWFGSTSHEAQGWLQVSEREMSMLRADHPTWTSHLNRL